MTVFAYLLAFGMLIHKSHLAEWVSLPFPFATAILAVVLLFRPESPRFFLAFLVSLIAETVWYAPFIVNHMMLVAYMGLGVVGAYVSVFRRTGKFPDSLAQLQEYCFPLFRTGVYVLFFFAILSRLNWGFLDPALTCSLDHYMSLQRRMPFLPSTDLPAMRYLVVYGGVLWESAIPFLLFFRRTRNLGVIVAFVFHFFIASNQAHAFSALSSALYLPFLSEEFYRSIGVAGRMLRRVRFGAYVPWILPLSMAGLVFVSILAASFGRTYRTEQLGHWLYWLFHASFFVVFLWATYGHRRWASHPTRLLHPRHAWQMALVGLLVLNGMTPYLGLKTQNAFSMWGNLRTEGEAWNHLFVPRWLKVFDYQQSLVSVTAIQVPEHARHFQLEQRLGFTRDYDMGHLDPATLVTEFEFKRILGLHCRNPAGPIFVDYEIDGQEYSVADACSEPGLSEGNNPILEKLLRFRHPVPRTDACPATT